MDESTSWQSNQTIPSTDKPWSSKGRFGRLSYFAWLFLVLLIESIILPFNSFGQQLTTSTQGSGMMVGGIAIQLTLFIVYLLIIYIFIVFGIRRFHDLNRTGWWILLMLIPIVNLLVCLYLAFAKGTAGTNRFGPERITKAWEKVLGWIYIIIVPIGIIAAVAIPAYQSYVAKTHQTQFSPSTAITSQAQ